MIDFAQQDRRVSFPVAAIKVIGVGGAGGNTVNAMIERQQDIEFIVANTDAQALSQSRAQHKVQLGLKATKGLGTGANPELGKRSAQESLDAVLELAEDANIVFLTGGMGGGTGSGGLPVIAQALREKGILTIAVVTKPFVFEGKKRAQVAQEAILALEKCVDTLLIVPNQKLLELVDATVSMVDAFAMINDVLYQSVKSISDIVTKPGHINVDFADVNSIMKNRGLSVMGSAVASGSDRAEKAAHEAINSPLLENMSIAGARGVLVNITGGSTIGLHEINTVARIVYEQVDEDANIIIGSVIDTKLEQEVMVTVIATGFGEGQERAESVYSLASGVSVRMTDNPRPVSQTEVSRQSTAQAEEDNEDSALQEQGTSDLDVPTFMRYNERQSERS